MEYIINLSLSGSCMIFIYWFLKLVFRENLTKKWEYILLKASLLYYIVPIPFVQVIYKDILRNLPFPISPSVNMITFGDSEKVVSYDRGGFYLNYAFKLSVLLFSIWMIVALFILCKNLLQYMKFHRDLLNCSESCEDADIKSLLHQLKKEYRIRRSIDLRLTSAFSSPFTLGIFHPIIIMSMEDSLKKQELILRHELIHNKRFDCITKVLTTYMLCFHWFNPLSYYLKKKMELVCETSCDEVVSNNMDLDGRSEYAKLIVNQLRRNTERAKFASFLSSPKMDVEERIKIIMTNQNKKKKLLTMLMPFLVVGAVLLNTGTAFAYEDVKVTEYENELSLVDLDVFEGADLTFSNQTETKTETSFDNNCSFEEIKFIDDNNVVHILTDSVSPYLFCNHNFIPGVYEAHRKYDDGTCTTLVYKAQMCTKCQHIKVGERTGEYYEKYCPHK